MEDLGEALKFRKECVDELIKYLETGNKDHIKIQSKMPTEEESKELPHFK